MNTFIEENISQDIDKEEEIDLSLFLNSILRNKFLIGFTTLFFFIGSCFYALSKKKIWQGNFEIVLADSNSKVNNPLSNFLNTSNLGNLPGISIPTVNNTLSTEVGILNSPSVLLPIYEYVQNTNKKEKTSSSQSFFNWKKDSLSVELEDGTSILNITYKDTNKDIIVPVLEKISKTYQSYSGENKNRNLKLANDYLIDQISIYKNKSSESIKRAQEYAIDQDLSMIDIDSTLGINKEINKSNLISKEFPVLNNIGIEGVRVNSANQIRKIEIQIEKIKNMKDDYNQLQYIGSTIPAIFSSELTRQLENIDAALLNLKSKYIQGDLEISRLEVKRESLIKLMKERSLGYLEAKKVALESLMESAIRPKGVLLKYKELIREAGRDENILVQLENQYRKIKLEEARLEDPWKLISNPTLKKMPVGPNRKRIAFTGFLVGLFFGVILSILKDKQKGLIFDEILLERSIGFKVLEIINLETGKFEKNNKTIFLNEVLNNLDADQVLLFRTNKISNVSLSKTIKLLSGEKFKFKEINDLSEVKKDQIILLITTLGSIDDNEISQIKNRLRIVNKDLFGILLIEES